MAGREYYIKMFTFYINLPLFMETEFKVTERKRINNLSATEEKSKTDV